MPIHELFQDLPDQQAAEALSELVVRHADLKRMALYPGDIAAQYAFTGEFPPVPAYMSTVTIAYAEDSGLTRRKFMDIPQHRSIDHAAARQEHVRALGAAVGLSEGLLDRDGTGGVEAYHASLIERIRKSGMRTVAALATFSSVETGQHFSGLLFSKKLALEVPLELRGDLSRDQEGAKDESLAEVRRLIMTNDPEAGMVMGILASLSLPKPEVVRQIVASTPLPTRQPTVNKDPRYEGLSRTERRKLEAQDRRNRRKGRPQS